MKLEKKRRQEGCQAPWLAELGGGGELVLETRSGEAVWLADRCMGYGVEERCWAQSPSGWGESDGHSSGINALEGMVRGGAREQLQHAGVGSCLSRAETWRTGLPTLGPPTQETELRPSTWSLDSEHPLFCSVWWKFKSTF